MITFLLQGSKEIESSIRIMQLLSLNEQFKISEPHNPELKKLYAFHKHRSAYVGALECEMFGQVLFAFIIWYHSSLNFRHEPFF